MIVYLIEYEPGNLYLAKDITPLLKDEKEHGWDKFSSVELIVRKKEFTGLYGPGLAMSIDRRDL